MLIPPERLPDYGIPLYCNRHRQRLEAEGLHPKRVQINAKRYAYVKAEVIAHAKALIAARDNGTSPKFKPTLHWGKPQDATA